ncbi:MAG: hypothetical protein KDK45_24500 [Leptospiraceae bacterium]|nr:hypothetical protein [Leptospiraceae bacterium]
MKTYIFTTGSQSEPVPSLFTNYAFIPDYIFSCNPSIVSYFVLTRIEKKKKKVIMTCSQSTAIGEKLLEKCK